MTEISITNVSALNENLSIYFNIDWEQEEISYLSELVFSGLTSEESSLKIQERIGGADRENIRFSWVDNYFILNFDCCSQSCWLEGQDEASTLRLSVIQSTLNKWLKRQ